MRERERELPLLYRSTWTYFIDVSWVEEVRYERIRRFLEIFFLRYLNRLNLLVSRGEWWQGGADLVNF